MTVHRWPIKINVPEGFALTGMGRWWIKDDRFFGSLGLHHKATKSRIYVTAEVPLEPIRRWAKLSAAQGAIDIGGYDGTVDIGWNPWKAIKNVGKKASTLYGTVSKTVQKVASNAAVAKIVDIVSNPSLGKIVSIASSLPSWAKDSASKLLGRAVKGQSVAKSKIANITDQAADGNETALALWTFLSQLFRGESTTVSGVPWPVTGPEQYEIGPSISGEGTDRLQVGGWLYHAPYRSNLEALDLDKTSPGSILRYLYHGGLEVEPKTIKWP